jgi:membrane protein implicated in regulation of membrane protease activity
VTGQGSTNLVFTILGFHAIIVIGFHHNCWWSSYQFLLCSLFLAFVLYCAPSLEKRKRKKKKKKKRRDVRKKEKRQRRFKKEKKKGIF